MSSIIIIIFLWLSILLYLLLGGADFGAGIIELFTSSKDKQRTRKTLYYAIGPIWEANHMWLIIAIVILFVGFPYIYTTLSIYLHIPLTIMLLGIIARGTAFVFRHYDAINDDWQIWYNRIYAVSSLITPLFLGIIAGSAVSGHINPQANDFISAYILGWFNAFSICVGMFTVSLCGFLASIYLIGEAESKEDSIRFIAKAKRMNIVAVLCGALVFIAAETDGIPLRHWVIDDIVGLSSVLLATISLFILWYSIRKGRTIIIRVLAGFQVTMILLAISYAHFPDFIILKNGEDLSLFDHQAPAKTMEALSWALILGSVFILPALFYLYYSFKKKIIH
jgi:cytochrome bd ubiquinol oxidase subunit II